MFAGDDHIDEKVYIESTRILKENLVLIQSMLKEMICLHPSSENVHMIYIKSMKNCMIRRYINYV